MDLQEVNKNEVDEPSFDEQVLLATQTINWISVRLQKIFQQQQQICDKPGAKEKFPYLINGVNNIQSFQNEFITDLIGLTERIGNFIDGIDANDQIDTVVTKAAYDVLYQRYSDATH